MNKLNRRVGVLAVAATFTIFGLPALAQQYEAAGILKRAANNLGANDLNTLIYSAAGNAWAAGQPYTAGKALPKQNYRITRTIDYVNAALSDDVTRSRAEPRGGTAEPLTGERNLIEAVGGNVTWNVANMNVAPGNRYVAERVPQIWLNPHGVIKSALKNNASLTFVTEGKKSLGVVSFSEPGRFSAKAFINDAAEVERIEAVVPSPVLGDMQVVTRYSEYRDFGRGVKFPSRIEETTAGQMTLQLVVTDVQPNSGKVAIQIPPAAANFKETVASTKLADGVWFLGGGSHNSVAIEMKDHAVVVEGPLYDARSQAVIDETKKLIPGKPIRFLLNTHVHFDHSGGVATFAAEGATIVTHQTNKAYFERGLAAKRTVSPDALAKSKKKANIRGVGEKFVHTDGNRTLEMHLTKDTIHNDGLMMVYLPKEKLLIQADMPGPLPAGAQPPAKPNPVLLNYIGNVERLKLAVDQVVPIHGPVHAYADVKRALGN
ncbi:MAG: MBL fold metallo-hydrolase [Betaproteobacteria bacterium]|nr:MBL fold metallo-hydrolase [Betaproteobacteria bacterium]